MTRAVASWYRTKNHPTVSRSQQSEPTKCRVILFLSCSHPWREIPQTELQRHSGYQNARPHLLRPNVGGFVPDFDPTGIPLLTARAEVSHPAVVSKATDCDDVGALAALGTLVDFVMFVERGARFATLMKMKEAKESEEKKKMRIKSTTIKAFASPRVIDYAWTAIRFFALLQALGCCRCLSSSATKGGVG